MKPLEPKPSRARRVLRRGVFATLAMVACAVIGGPIAVALDDYPPYASWREARANSTRSVGIAPAVGPGSPAVVQIYEARVWGARRPFAVHTWIAVKDADADAYVVLEVIGWRLRRGLPVVAIEARTPDLPWYGASPGLLVDLRGPAAAPLVSQVIEAAARYPWDRSYRAWPGPNSNTFTAWVGRAVPALGLDLPATAIGKDFRPLTDALGVSTSGTGLQATLLGVVGITAGIEEGLELNLLGLHLEIDLMDLALELPGWGRVGPAPVSGVGSP